MENQTITIDIPTPRGSDEENHSFLDDITVLEYNTYNSMMDEERVEDPDPNYREWDFTGKDNRKIMNIMTYDEIFRISHYLSSVDKTGIWKKLCFLLSKGINEENSVQ